MPDRQVPKAGRPRDPGVDEAIKRAAMEVFRERGYPDASLQEIARRAGVGTPTVYRRWSKKSFLAIDILGEAVAGEAPETGDIRADLATFLRDRIDVFSDPLLTQVLLGVATVGFVLPAVGERGQEVWRRVSDPMRSRLRLAKERGELPSDLDVELVFDAAVGSMLFPLLITHESRRPEDAERIVALLLG